MKQLYNTQTNIASNLSKFFNPINNNLSKPQLRLISPIILAMIESESIVTTDIVKKLKGDFAYVKASSTVRRLERFLTIIRMYHLSCYFKKNLIIL